MICFCFLQKYSNFFDQKFEFPLLCKHLITAIPTSTSH